MKLYGPVGTGTLPLSLNGPCVVEPVPVTNDGLRSSPAVWNVVPPFVDSVNLAISGIPSESTGMPAGAAAAVPVTPFASPSVVLLEGVGETVAGSFVGTMPCEKMKLDVLGAPMSVTGLL